MSDIDDTTRGDRTAGTARAAAAVAPATNNGHDDGRRAKIDPTHNVRNADIEPYTGLRYLSKLFRIMAIILVLMLLAEVVTGLMRQGTDSIPTLVSEASRLIVLAGLLWGIGDLAILLIDVGHDVRATRILLGRQTAHLMHHPDEHSVVHDSAVASRAREME